MESPEKVSYIVLGGGCFWCVEAVFLNVDGVLSAESGYTGGKTKNPNYKDICTGSTGHAEVVKIGYDSTKISLVEILEIFFATHDPTTLNRQGADVGTQYRSAIFYNNESQRNTALEYISFLENEKAFDSKIVTEVTALPEFYKAEDYHQNYYNNNPYQGYCQFVINPKLQKLKSKFGNKLKKN
ncbi:peptide-methionine (S)-S-oxide reductase MsrA [Candidatus Kapaibacterium sp.]